jgi:hypothetical protein
VVYSSTGGPRCAWGELAIIDPIAQQQIVDSPILRLFDGQRSTEWSSHHATIGDSQSDKDFLTKLKGGHAIGLFHIGAAGNSCDVCINFHFFFTVLHCIVTQCVDCLMNGWLLLWYITLS